jgi:hypothetical protein
MDRLKALNMAIMAVSAESMLDFATKQEIIETLSELSIELEEEREEE